LSGLSYPAEFQYLIFPDKSEKEGVRFLVAMPLLGESYYLQIKPQNGPLCKQ
jgi:hypothetical protein